MTILQLIKDLHEVHKDMGDVEVLLASDAEGNNYRPFLEFGDLQNSGKHYLVLYPTDDFAAEIEDDTPLADDPADPSPA